MRSLRFCAALVLLCACSTTLPMRMRILDESGNPVPGAVLYVEVVSPGERPEPADFAFAVAGADGWAPPLDAPAPELRHPWRSCATIAYLLPGRPYVYPGKPPCIAPTEAHPAAVATLPTWSAAAGSGLPRLLFPFEGKASLRARAADPAAAPLRAALREAAQLLHQKLGIAGELLGALDRLEAQERRP